MLKSDKGVSFSYDLIIFASFAPETNKPTSLW